MGASIDAAADAGIPLAQNLVNQFGSGINILRASPYNPVGGDLTRVRFRSLTQGPRLDLFDTRFYEGVFGAKGSIKTFTYDLTLSHTEDKQISSVSGDVRAAQTRFSPMPPKAG